MRYNQKIILKNGKEAWLRNGDASDGKAVYENFNTTLGFNSRTNGFQELVYMFLRL